MSEKKEKKEKMNTGMKIIIILLSVLIIGGTSFGVYYFFIANNNGKVEVKHPLTDEKTFSLEEFKLNLADTDRTKYIQATIYVGYKSNSKLESELDEKKQIIRDTVNTVIRSKKASQLTVSGTQELKKILIKQINPLLEHGKIDNIYYDSIIIQQ